MVTLSLKVLVVCVLARSAVAGRVEQMQHDERGEIGSWMILAAGLAVAAAAAVLVLGPWFDQKAADITSN